MLLARPALLRPAHPLPLPTDRPCSGPRTPSPCLRTGPAQARAPPPPAYGPTLLRPAHPLPLPTDRPCLALSPNTNLINVYLLITLSIKYKVILLCELVADQNKASFTQYRKAFTSRVIMKKPITNRRFFCTRRRVF